MLFNTPSFGNLDKQPDSLVEYVDLGEMLVKAGLYTEIKQVLHVLCYKKQQLLG